MNVIHPSYADYYPFGMKMPGKFGGGSYRYAYQGQEKDTETGFEAFELRQWDGRIGRWMTIDPYGQYASPYLGMGNNPMRVIDPDGGEGNDWWENGTTGEQKWFEGSESPGSDWTHLSSDTWLPEIIASPSNIDWVSYSDWHHETVYQPSIDAQWSVMSRHMDEDSRSAAKGTALMLASSFAAPYIIAGGTSVAGLGMDISAKGLGGVMWESSTFGPASRFFGRYHSKYVPFGVRGTLNKALKEGFGAGWSSHMRKHVFRIKYNGKKILDIFK